MLKRLFTTILVITTIATSATGCYADTTNDDKALAHEMAITSITKVHEYEEALNIDTTDKNISYNIVGTIDSESLSYLKNSGYTAAASCEFMRNGAWLNLKINEDEIYNDICFDKDMDYIKAMTDSRVLHEVIHIKQWLNNPAFEATWNGRVEAEREAHLYQVQYLIETMGNDCGMWYTFCEIYTPNELPEIFFVTDLKQIGYNSNEYSIKNLEVE